MVIRSGWAYVPEREQSSIIFHDFERKLQEGLEVRLASLPCLDFVTTIELVFQMTAKALPRLDEDTRIMPILDHLGQGFLSGMSVASEYMAPEGSAEGVTADKIDEMAQKHWPLCMRHLHDCLKRDRHLKHFGRLQHGLFLKVRS